MEGKLKTLRIGLLGASTVATYAVIAPARETMGVEVSAIAARDPQKAAAYAAQHGIARALPSYEALYADPDIDLVYIGTPPAFHAEQAMAAMAAGKPVLVEKPFSLASSDAREVLAASRKLGVPLFEAMHSPHHALFARILEIIRGGEIGELERIEAFFEAPIDPQDPIRWNAGLGGGALMDLGVYPLAWVRRIAGEDFSVTSASATMRSGVDAAFEAQLAYASGVTAHVAASMIAEAVANRLTIQGTRGRLQVANPLAPHRGHALRLDVGGAETREIVEGPSTYSAQLSAVRATILEGAAFPFPDDDFVASMEAIERVRSAL